MLKGKGKILQCHLTWVKGQTWMWNLQSQCLCKKAKHNSPINTWKKVLESGLNSQCGYAFQWKHLTTPVTIPSYKRLVFFKKENKWSGCHIVHTACQLFTGVWEYQLPSLHSPWELLKITILLYREGKHESIPTWRKRNLHYHVAHCLGYAEWVPRVIFYFCSIHQSKTSW